MSASTKTDNHFLEAKLELRRRILSRQTLFEKLSVADCFSGGEALWNILQKEFPVGDYLALDVKPKRGRLKMDSIRYLENQKWEQNVIDLDAYGSPWRHYFEVLKRGRSCIVFLTIGNTLFKQQQTEAIERLGITFRIPNGLQGPLSEIICDVCVAELFKNGFAVHAALEALNPGGSARYIGLILEKKSVGIPTRRRKSPMITAEK